MAYGPPGPQGNSRRSTTSRSCWPSRRWSTRWLAVCPVIGNISAPSTNLTVRLARGGAGVGSGGYRRDPAVLLPVRSGRGSRALPLHQGAVGRAAVGLQHPGHRQDGGWSRRRWRRWLARARWSGVKDSSGAGEAFAQLRALCDQGGIEMYRFLGSVFRVSTASAVGAHGVIPRHRKPRTGRSCQGVGGGGSRRRRDGAGLPGEGDGGVEDDAPREGWRSQRIELLRHEIRPQAHGRDRQRHCDETPAAADRGREEGHTGHPARGRHLALRETQDDSDARKRRFWYS